MPRGASNSYPPAPRLINETNCASPLADVSLGKGRGARLGGSLTPHGGEGDVARGSREALGRVVARIAWSRGARGSRGWSPASLRSPETARVAGQLPAATRTGFSIGTPTMLPHSVQDPS